MKMNSYSSLCDDFYLDLHINTELDLPTQRDTVLAFFERIQKQLPSMGRFYRRGDNEYCLEEDRNLGQYRWVSLELDRIGSGVVNPSDFDTAYLQDKFILELVPYMLGVSHLDIESLDVTFAMDFDFAGSHDEVIAEALFGSCPFSCLLDVPGGRPIGFSPAIVVALSDDEHTQARVSVESKTSVLDVREKKQSATDAISLSLTIRQYPRTHERFDPMRSFERQCNLGEELMAERIVPELAKPLTETIAQRRST
ncbi:MAG: hypothetical protein JSU70_16025 [Phycisphaerales bacterium]|nr:MAG: hypothetical protein JSU70_16025 [Phycisphaerales bacterium]